MGILTQLPIIVATVALCAENPFDSCKYVGYRSWEKRTESFIFGAKSIARKYYLRPMSEKIENYIES